MCIVCDAQRVLTDASKNLVKVEVTDITGPPPITVELYDMATGENFLREILTDPEKIALIAIDPKHDRVFYILTFGNGAVRKGEM